MGILFGHMLPKRGQLFMTPAETSPTAGGIDCPFINRSVSALAIVPGKGNETTSTRTGSNPGPLLGDNICRDCER